MLEGEGISVTGVTACVDSDGDYADAYAEGVRCYLSIDSLLGARRHDLKVDVYPLENVRRYLKHETATLEGAVTEYRRQYCEYEQ